MKIVETKAVFETLETLSVYEPLPGKEPEEQSDSFAVLTKKLRLPLVIYLCTRTSYRREVKNNNSFEILFIHFLFMFSYWYDDILLHARTNQGHARR
jgi:hypothetical protein